MAKGKKKEPVINTILKKLYYNPKSTSSYGSKAALQRGLKQELKKKKGRIKRTNLPRQVKTWLEDQKTYTLHKQPKKTFPRRQVIVSGINDQWQADLADMQLLAYENQGFRYILIVIDCFSRKAWAHALKDKTGKSVADAFNYIFTNQEPPKSLQTDKGK